MRACHFCCRGDMRLRPPLDPADSVALKSTAMMASARDWKSQRECQEADLLQEAVRLEFTLRVCS